MKLFAPFGVSSAMKASRLILAAFAAVAAVAVPAASASGCLPAPSSVEASDGAYDGAVMISWTEVPGAESYRIFRSDSADWMAARAIGVTSDTAFIDPAISNDSRRVYHYWIIAEAGYAVSVFSESDSGRIRPGTALAQQPMRQNFRRLRSRMVR